MTCLNTQTSILRTPGNKIQSVGGGGLVFSELWILQWVYERNPKSFSLYPISINNCWWMTLLMKLMDTRIQIEDTSHISLMIQSESKLLFLKTYILNPLLYWIILWILTLSPDLEKIYTLLGAFDHVPKSFCENVGLIWQK